jgi:hypothetical protein
VIVKSAFDWKLAAHALHFETAGLLRTFKVFDNLVTPNATNAITEVSGSVNLNFEVFRNFHLMANTFYGAGNGRYIGALGPDAIVRADGTLSPLHSGSDVAGSEYQVTPRFAFDTYYSCPYFHSTIWVPARPLHRSAMASPASPVWASRVPPTQTTVISGRDRRVYPDDLGEPEPREVAIHKPLFSGGAHHLVRSCGRPEKRTHISGIYRSSLRSFPSCTQEEV